jgi:hypothetical protein
MRLKWSWWKSRRTDDSGQAPGSAKQATGRSAADQPRSGRFTHLPERIDPKDTVTSKRVDPPRDPEGGRDTERDFLLRYGSGGDDTPWDPTDG